MNPQEPSSAFAVFYDGVSPVSRRAQVLWFGETLRVVVDAKRADYPIAHVKLSPGTGSRHCFLDLPDGSELQCSNARLLRAMRARATEKTLVDWLDEHWWAALASTLITCAFVVVLYSFASPLVATYVSERVDLDYEREIGESTLKSLDQTVLSPTQLSAQERGTTLRDFEALAAGLPQAGSYRLEFRKGRGDAANAFALPGGLIVVTDALFRSCSSDGVLAVLAHEIGHVEKRHVMRQALQDSAVNLVLSVLLADVASAASSLSDLPEAIATNRYSRDFEREADAFAFTLLEAHAKSPEAFAQCMDRLSGSYEATRALNFLSTHPLTAERSAHARRRARALDDARSESNRHSRAE